MLQLKKLQLHISQHTRDAWVNALNQFSDKKTQLFFRIHFLDQADMTWIMVDSVRSQWRGELQGLAGHVHMKWPAWQHYRIYSTRNSGNNANYWYVIIAVVNDTSQNLFTITSHLRHTEKIKGKDTGQSSVAKWLRWWANLARCENHHWSSDMEVMGLYYPTAGLSRIGFFILERNFSGFLWPKRLCIYSSLSKITLWPFCSRVLSLLKINKV